MRMSWGASRDLESENDAASNDANGGDIEQLPVPVPVPRPLQHILDVARKASTKEKANNALKHFEFYASQHFGKIIKADNVSYDELNQDLFGGLATYLATSAHYYRDPRKGLLSLNSAQGYLSAIKMHYVNKYREFREPSVFSKEHWSRIKAGVNSEFVERSKRTGKELVQSREGATDDDIIAMHSLCAWNAEQWSAEFMHFNNSMINLAGRGSEIAHTRHEHVTTTLLDEMIMKCKVLQHYCNRFKTGTIQDLHVFCHKERWQMDYYFSAAYCYVMCGGAQGNDFVFPTFAKQAMKEDAAQKKTSKVANHWKDKFKLILNYWTNYYKAYEGGDNDGEDGSNIDMVINQGL
jgi:hypothetical protein